MLLLTSHGNVKRWPEKSYLLSVLERDMTPGAGPRAGAAGAQVCRRRCGTPRRLVPRAFLPAGVSVRHALHPLCALGRSHLSRPQSHVIVAL